MSKRSELLNIIEGYKRQQEEFKSKVSKIEKTMYLTE